MHAGRAVTALALAVAVAACTSTGERAGPTTAAAPTTATTTPTASVSVPTTAPATTSTVAPSTTPSTAAPDPAACVRALPLTTRAGQLVWPAVYGDELVERTGDLAGWQAGGAVLMTWPDGAREDDLRAMKAAGTIPLLVATDEEGGRVQRMERYGVLPSAREVAATMTPDDAREMIAAHARAVHDAGIDVVFAPVVDVRPAQGDGPIGSRAFSRDPAVVTAFAEAYVDGWESAGILPVLKHFPGHGGASADTHDLAATTAPLAELRARDLLPYAALRDSGAGVMVGHLDVPGLTDREGVPASLSRDAITTLLRGEYGYGEALVFTDALGMKAISDELGVVEASRRAVAAGADVVIFTLTDDTPLVIDGLVAAVEDGSLDKSRLDEAVLHVLRTKRIDPCSLAVST